MAFRFEQLEVWHIALKLSNEIDYWLKSFQIEKDLAYAVKLKEPLIL